MNHVHHAGAETLTTVLLPFLVAVVTSVFAFLIQRSKLRTEFRTEFMAEAAARILLTRPDWKKRSFEAISKKLGGFGEDELRKILVRAGAVRFEGKDGELWGLIERNESDLQG